MKKQLSLIIIPVAVLMLLSSLAPAPLALSKEGPGEAGNPDFKMLEGNAVDLEQDDLEDNGLGKHMTADDQQKEMNGEVQNPIAPMGADAQIQELMAMIQALQMEIKAMRAELKGLAPKAAPAVNPQEAPEAAKPQKAGKVEVTAEQQAAAGVIITGGVSGPGYPTGPLNISLPATSLLFDRPGTVKEKGAQLQIQDRQYEAPLETIPPTLGSFPVVINGVANTATQVKVISSLKTKDGVGQHQGTIDIDIDTAPLGHVTLAYSGAASVANSTIYSKGTFKTTKAEGIFAGLVAEGTYEMTIVESGVLPGMPAMVTITTATP